MRTDRRAWLVVAAVVTAAAWSVRPGLGAPPRQGSQPAAKEEARPAAQPQLPPPGGACNASSSWVTNPSQPNFNQNPSSLCAFYQYSWQSFLYLTSPSAGPGSPLNFESYASVSEVFQPASLQAQPCGGLLMKSGRRRIFTQRGSKPTHKLVSKAGAAGEFSEDTQAGSRGVLVDQGGTITYYEQLLDPVSVNFIDQCDLTVKSCQQQTAAAKLRMPAGALEIKSSWRPMSKASPDVGKFYTITGAEIQNPDGSCSTPDFMALVGFHLVYTTPGHPEMVWATFEHAANAPDGPCASGQSTCGQVPAGFSGWSYNDCKSTSCANANTWPSPAPTAAPRPPYYPITQAFQDYPYGASAKLFGGSIAGGQPNIDAITSLNRSVLSVLPQGSVWRYYFLSGAVWTNGTLPAVAPFSPSGQKQETNEIGSVLLANSTMETFTQFPNPVPSPFPTAGPCGSRPCQSCFSCHNNQFGSTIVAPFFVSHAFFAAKDPSPCPYTTTLPQACQATQGATPAPKK